MDTLLIEVVKGIPSFAGLVFLALVLREINQQQWALIERILDNCTRLESAVSALADRVDSSPTE